MLSTSALKPIPIEPSSRPGLTITGKSMSCAQSSRPRKTVTNFGVRMPWNCRTFLVRALSMARDRPRGPDPVYRSPSNS